MALLPTEAVQASVAAEMPAVEAWTARRRMRFEYRAEVPALRIWLKGPGGEPYLLEGTFEEYPTLPPAWRFLHPVTGEQIGRAAYPAPAQPHRRGSPLIIDSGTEGVVICAHFNRLAFVDEGGPHGDWGPLANWRNQPPKPYTFADNIADMASRIAVEVSDSAGRKAPL